jgi:tRNA 5-methylaminomethyl-2-thiouridine biosynthesis bifunctional protein
MADTDPFTLKRPHAALTWGEGGPVSDVSGDVYFSVENGLEETRAVFLAGAGFPNRFNRDLTVVGELGFGTGLNFLALWRLFLDHAPADARLHFVTVEGWPLHRDDAAKALDAFPELADLAAPLIEAWPSPHKGAHRRVFAGDRVTLTVFHDESEAALANMAFQADAWFLDGFSPAKNPDMWTPALFQQIARLSKPGAPAATFTVAGAVRRGLAEAGFAVEKRPGFGRKRERLEAIYQGGHASQPAGFPRPVTASGSIAIIGGGIAAAGLVEAFKRRGRIPTVFAKGGWASGASGAPLGLLTPRLEAADRPHNRALLAAFDYASNLYRQAGWLDGEGVLRCAADARGQERLHTLADQLDDRFSWCDAAEAAARTGLECEPGLWVGPAGAFQPETIVRGLAAGLAPVDADIVALSRGDDGWRLRGSAGGWHGPFETVIIAGGFAGSGLGPLPLEATAGQVACFETPDRLATPVAWGGYAAPVRPGEVLVGATHIKGEEPAAADEAEQDLRASLEGGPIRVKIGERTQVWDGVRAATADRLPACGLAPDETFADQWREAARRGLAPDGSKDGLGGPILLTAFGARGFAHAPLLAEELVSALCGEPSAFQADGLQALHPARFAWRALRRGG